jgi:hypothetical protein
MVAQFQFGASFLILEAGVANSTISFSLAANWMSFELTLNRIVTPINSKQSLCHGQIDKIFAARSTEKIPLLYKIKSPSGKFALDTSILCRRLRWVVINGIPFHA